MKRMKPTGSVGTFSSPDVTSSAKYRDLDIKSVSPPVFCEMWQKLGQLTIILHLGGHFICKLIELLHTSIRD